MGYNCLGRISNTYSPEQTKYGLGFAMTNHATITSLENSEKQDTQFFVQ